VTPNTQAVKKFRGICRGLIEACRLRDGLAHDRENSAASAAASLKLDRRLRIDHRLVGKFRGICRGLIEALLESLNVTFEFQNSAASAAASLKLIGPRCLILGSRKIPRHLPRPH